MNAKLLPIMQAMFVETNPIPIKESLYHMGMMEKEFRLPCVPCLKKAEKFLKGILKEYGALKKRVDSRILYIVFRIS